MLKDILQTNKSILESEKERVKTCQTRQFVLVKNFTSSFVFSWYSQNLNEDNTNKLA